MPGTSLLDGSHILHPLFNARPYYFCVAVTSTAFANVFSSTARVEFPQPLTVRMFRTYQLSTIAAWALQPVQLMA